MVRLVLDEAVDAVTFARLLLGAAVSRTRFRTPMLEHLAMPQRPIGGRRRPPRSAR